MTSQFLSHLRTELATLKDAGLYKAERVITSKQAGEIAIASGERVLNFCANNYLGLADNAELAEAGKQALEAARVPADQPGIVAVDTADAAADPVKELLASHRVWDR